MWVDFLLVTVFYAQNIFVKKIINKLEIVFTTSIYYTTAAETNNLHVILKCDFYLTENEDLTCFANVCLKSKVLDMTDNQKLIMSYDTIKHKTIILTGYLKDKFRDCSSLAMEDEKNTMYSEFLQNLCWRGLALIKLLTVHFA